MIGRLMVSALALTGVANAQTPPNTDQAAAQPTANTAPTGRLSYDAAHFTQFNPRNALDMVRQTPGFSLDGGDDERRGFSGAVGNLLIDGLRPSTKSQSLEDILSRIPANQVVRIEVLRGSDVAGDASGASTLVNVVRTPSAGSGLWEAGFELTSRDVLAPRGELSYSGRNGQIEWGVGTSIFSQYRDLPGWRRVTDANGDLIGTVDTPQPRDFREAAINGNLAFPMAGGRLTTNAEVRWWRYHQESGIFAIDPIGDPLEDLTINFEERRPSAELGANYDRDFGPWSLAVIGLLNRAQYSSDEAGDLIDYVDASNSFTYFQDVQQEIGESILRGTLSRALSPQHRIEIGGEGAFNSLDQELVFLQDGVPQDLPNVNVLIEEQRAEFFGSHAWRIADNWSLDSRLAWETSTLTFTGDTDQTVELSFWKPSVQLTRTFAGNNQVRFRVYRDVGQLDFGDFVSAAAVADAIIAGGNPNLSPQTSWIAELGADLRFGDAALSAVLSHHQITDVQDLVTLVDDRGTVDPLDDRLFDAPGNIGDGEVTRLDVDFSSPVPFIPGGRITIAGYVRETEVTDPLTQRPRIISETPESNFEISFRQDIPSWRFSWGAEISKQGEFQAYRFNEIDTSDEGPWIDLWAETTALPNDMRLRVWAANAFDGKVFRDRNFFGDLSDADPLNDGRTGPFRGRDLRQRQFRQAPWLIVELSGSF